jgi:uncharacterized protein (DUF2267 family)
MTDKSVGMRSGTADRWLDTVATELGTDDRDFAERVLRSWLQMIHERLTAPAAAAFAAELPESVRRLFLTERDGIAHSAKRGAAAYTIRFARNAGIAVQDVRAVSSSVTVAMMLLMRSAAVDRVLGELDTNLQVLVRGRAA